MKEPLRPNMRPVTMREVAEAAGVSISTVSLVINNKTGARIGTEARERVHHAIERLGYRPNALAKDLVSGQTRFIGLVADAIASTPFAGQIIHGAQDEAWRHGLVLLVTNTEGDKDVEGEAIRMMLEHKVRGILYSTWYHREVEAPAGLTEAECVLVNCFARRPLPAVVPDELSGGREATALLLQSGHERVAFLNTTWPSPARDGRLEGFVQAHREAGLVFDPSLVIDVDPDQEGGYAAVDAMLALDVSGVFCHNDRVAMGVYDALRDKGLRVPDDLAIVGFDNQEVIAAHLRPPLTTVALPHYELGQAGVRVLLGLERTDNNNRLTVRCPPVLRESVVVRDAPSVRQPGAGSERGAGGRPAAGTRRVTAGTRKTGKSTLR